MATRGENCYDWPRTVMTGGCLLVVFAPDGATDNDDENLGNVREYSPISKLCEKDLKNNKHNV